MIEEKVMGKLTASQILQEVREAISPQPNQDKNWKTAVAWGEEWELCGPHARRMLREAVEAGVMECKKLLVRDCNGVVKHQPHYRYIPKSERKAPPRKKTNRKTLQRLVEDIAGK
jgi:hypothetical protein